MKRCAFLTIAIGIACAMAACGGVSDKTCTTNADCVEGLVCDNTGTCVEREPLSIVTKSLPDATVGVAYRVTLQATGGIPDYTWGLDYRPEWMSVDENSGELSGTPDAPGSDLAVGIKVTDDSAGTQSATAQLLITVLNCIDGDSDICYEADAGKCMKGNMFCNDGGWGDCTNTALTSLMEHCGPECGACDNALADSCQLGLCTCGNNAACSVGEACCLQSCVDVQSDDNNCGACDTRCENEAANAVNPHCEQGRCDYDTCDPAFLDLDGDRSNGCEAARDVENCEGIGHDCRQVLQHAEGIECRLNPANGRYYCAYEACEFGFYDCGDDEDDNVDGCETAASASNCTGCFDLCVQSPDGPECLLLGEPDQQVYACGCSSVASCGDENTLICCQDRCVARDSDEFCGDCSTDCNQSPLGPTCVDPQFTTCGCLDVSECEGLGDLCCGQACLPFSEDNCGQCGRVCDPFQDAGPVCELVKGVCYCENDAQCNDHAGSMSQCRGSGTGAFCACTNEDLPCQGGSGSQCCQPQNGDPACVNVMEDPMNCGRCGVRCDDGANCVQGRCECGNFPELHCPPIGPAPNCHGGTCSCDNNPAGNEPCSEGRMCCHGTDEGSGGPAGGPDEGCCWNPCGENAPGDCLY